MGLPDASDLDFLEKFERCSLEKASWTHRAHIRMAWIQLSLAKSFLEGLEKIRSGIRRYNASMNNPGYHETVTVAFARLIHTRMSLAETFCEFADKNADLLVKTPAILHQYYSAEILGSPEAKDKFVEPDKRKLPSSFPEEMLRRP